MKKVKGLFYDGLHQPKEVLINLDGLEEAYKLLDCLQVEVVSRAVQGRYYEFMCDEEGVFNKGLATATCLDADENILGELLILKRRNDSFKSLTDDEIAILENNTLKTQPREWLESAFYKTTQPAQFRLMYYCDKANSKSKSADYLRRLFKDTSKA